MMKKYEKHMGVWCCLVMSINVDAHLCPAVKVTAHVYRAILDGQYQARIRKSRIGGSEVWFIMVG